MKSVRELCRCAFALCLLSLASPAVAQTNAGEFRPELLYVGKGNFSNNVARPLRYTPVDGDFVITNGAEFFNRPLYGPNNSFRADAGDKPELSLYLPGRGGNLRLGICTPAGVKWLNDADRIVARYRAGSMVYDIKDAEIMGNRRLHVVVVPLAQGRGVIVRAELNSAWMPCDLVWAFGGPNGMKGKRNGDIGCEREPVTKFFQLKPDQCVGSDFTSVSNTFVLKTKTATIAGTASAPAEHVVGDAGHWSDLARLLADRHVDTAQPVIAGSIPLPQGAPVYLALQHLAEGATPLSAADLPKAFETAEARRRALAERVKVSTPDGYVNAAAAALNVAADAVWDSQQQSFMHGAVAWRQRLLGWRGPYAGDALGWHERTRAHFSGYARGQNTNAISDPLPPADEDSNLARNETALHSNGDLMNRSHYDMNLVAVDAFFRHLLWTGDTNYARTMWPVIQRHLAWERRLFRREFGPDKLPLYEAYAAIWASDDLQYHGGGSTHGSAYNYWHNRMAAKVAKILGEDATPYDHEADLIQRGMNRYLWLSQAGTFAEFKDLLGLQLTHDSPALWTFYHTLDCDAATPEQTWQMSHWVDENIVHIPVMASGSSDSREAKRAQLLSPLPEGEGQGEGERDAMPYVLPTSNWMPYQWSINNVVLAEEAHTSLAYWQAGRPEEAFRLFKGFTLGGMFMGLCPGNVGAMMSYDMARGEAQRDFADGCGAMSRALVEGLFGVRPDVLAGELKIVPGFPSAWTNVAMTHPDFGFQFRRGGVTETYSIESKFHRPMSLCLQAPVSRAEVASVLVNGRPAKWHWLTNTPGVARVEVLAEASPKWDVVIIGQGGAFPLTPALSLGEREKRSQSSEKTSAVSGSAALRESKSSQLVSPLPEGEGKGEGEGVDWNKKLPDTAKLETISLTSTFNDKVTQIFRNEYRSPRSPFCSLAMPKQGIGGWCEPNEKFEVDDSGLRAVAAKSGGKVLLPNGVPLATPGEADAKNIAFVSQWDNYPRARSVPLTGKAARAFLLMAGSSNPMQSRMDNGEVIVTYTDGSTDRLALRNPETWWPIDQDYFVDDFAFRFDAPLPVRVDLQTGKVRVLEMASFKGRGGRVPGGAATVLTLPLDPKKELKSLTVRALANEVVIGLMSVTLERR